MKLHKRLLLFGASAILLAACGTDEGSTEETGATEEPETEEVAEDTEAEDTTDEETEMEEEPNEEAPNKETTENQALEQTTNGLNEEGVVVEYPYTVSTPNAEYTINSVERSKGSMTGAPIITLNLTFTNLTDETQSPYMQMVSDFNIIQTDGTTTESLMGANSEMGHLENQEAVEMGDTQVNGGATVEATIGYQLTIPENPVGFIYRPSEITGEDAGFIIRD